MAQDGAIFATLGGVTQSTAESIILTVEPAVGPKFHHRIDKDGTVQSVCMKCFVTVSRTWGNVALTVEELCKIEAAHVCEPKSAPVKAAYRG